MGSIPVVRDTEYSDKQQNMASLEGRVLVGGSLRYSSKHSQPRPQVKATGRRSSRPDRLTPHQTVPLSPSAGVGPPGIERRFPG